MAKEVLDVLVELREERAPHAVATVVETEGSVSARTGSKAVLDADGRLLAGWVGGGCAESATSQTALECLRSGEAAMIDIDLTDEMLGAGMPCGGRMRLFVEPVLPRPTLWIMGHGRVAECLCQIGDLVGLDVIVNDPSVTRAAYPAARRLVTDDLEYAELRPRDDDYVVVATQHKGDDRSIGRALGAGAGYIALIASRKRAEVVFGQLREQGVADADLARVRSPAGLEIGARTPEEIALSVISEIVQRRRGAGTAS